MRRTVTPSVPVRVDYELPPLGQSLLPTMRTPKNWAEENYDQVESCRVAYDGDRP